MKLFGMIKLVFYGLFILFNAVNIYLMHRVESSESACSNDIISSKTLGALDDAKLIKLFAYLSIGIGLINIFMSLTKKITSIPLIGSLISLGFIVVITLQLYLFTKLVNKLNSSDCKIELNSDLRYGLKAFGSLSIVAYIIIVVITVVGLVYF